MSEQPAPRRGRGLEVNLLPPSYRRRRITKRRLFIGSALLAAIGLIVPLYLLVTSALSQTGQLQFELHVVSQQVQLKQSKIDTVSQLQKQTQAYQSLSAGRGQFSTKLKVVTDKATAIIGITLTDISLLGDEIDVTGTATTDAALFGYRDSLREEWGAAVGEPELQGQKAPWTFTITIKP